MATLASYHQPDYNGAARDGDMYARRRNTRAYQHPQATPQRPHNVQAYQHPVATRPPGGTAPLASYSTAAAPAAPATDYASQYRDSLARSRAGIEDQFRTAFEDIAKREAGAQAAVNTLPGEITGIYDRSKANLGQQTAALDAGQGATGLQSFTTAAQQMAPLAATSGMDLANRQADVPLLRLGATAAFDTQRGGLNQAKLGALGDLASEERGYVSSLAQAQEQAKIDKANQTDNYMRDLQGKDWLANQDFGRQQAAAGIEARQARDEEGRSLNTFGGQDASAARGQWLRDYQPHQYRDVAGSKAYRTENQRVRREQDNQNDQNDIAGAIERLRRRGLYRTAAIFAQRHHAGRVK